MEYKDFLDIYYAGPETTFKLFLRVIETRGKPKRNGGVKNKAEQ